MHWVDKAFKTTLLSPFGHPHEILRMTTKLPSWKKTLELQSCWCSELLLITSNRWLVIATVNLIYWRSALTKRDRALGLGYIVMFQQKKSKVRQPIGTADWKVGLEKSSHSVGAERNVADERAAVAVGPRSTTVGRRGHPPFVDNIAKNLKPTRSWP